jgi:hypothetical protein
MFHTKRKSRILAVLLLLGVCALEMKADSVKPSAAELVAQQYPSSWLVAATKKGELPEVLSKLPPKTPSGMIQEAARRWGQAHRSSDSQTPTKFLFEEVDVSPKVLNAIVVGLLQGGVTVEQLTQCVSDNVLKDNLVQEGCEKAAAAFLATAWKAADDNSAFKSPFPEGTNFKAQQQKAILKLALKQLSHAELKALASQEKGESQKGKIFTALLGALSIQGAETAIVSGGKTPKQLLQEALDRNFLERGAFQFGALAKRGVVKARWLWNGRGFPKGKGTPSQAN